MPEFTYTGSTEVVFIGLSTEGHGVQLKPGDTVTLDADPGVPELVAVTDQGAKTKARTPATVPDVAPAIDPDPTAPQE